MPKTRVNPNSVIAEIDRLCEELPRCDVTTDEGLILSAALLKKLNKELKKFKSVIRSPETSTSTIVNLLGTVSQVVSDSIASDDDRIDPPMVDDEEFSYPPITEEGKSAVKADWENIGGRLLELDAENGHPLPFSLVALPSLAHHSQSKNPSGILFFDVDETLIVKGQLINKEKIQLILEEAKEKNILIGICTARYFHREPYTTRLVRSVVEELGSDYFSLVIYTNANHKHFPLLKISEENNVPLHHTVLVDDRKYNLTACREAKLHAIDALCETYIQELKNFLAKFSSVLKPIKEDDELETIELSEKSEGSLTLADILAREFGTSSLNHESNPEPEPETIKHCCRIC